METEVEVEMVKTILEIRISTKNHLIKTEKRHILKSQITAIALYNQKREHKIRTTLQIRVNHRTETSRKEM